MKRSKSISLAFMASAAITVTACSDQSAENSKSAADAGASKGEFYRNVDDCIKAEVYTPEFCTESFEAMEKQVSKTAPRYGSREACIENFSDEECRQVSTDEGSYFSPSPTGAFITGMLLGNMMNSGDRRDIRPAQPVYTSKSGVNVSRSQPKPRISVGGKSYSSSSAAISPKPPKVQTRTSAASRGGFGGRSSYGGSFGG